MMKEQKSLWHYIRQYKFGSLLVRNFGFIFLLVIAPMLFVSGYGYRQLSNTTNEHMASMNAELLEKSVAVTDNVMQDLSEQLSQVMVLPAVSRTLAGFPHSTGSAVQEIIDWIGQSPFIENVYLYSAVNGIIYDLRSGRDMYVHQVTEKANWYHLYNQGRITSPHVLVDKDKNIYFCGPVSDREGNPLGLVVFDIQMQKIQELLEREGLLQSSIFFLAGLDGSIIYCNRQDENALSDRELSRLRDMFSGVTPGSTEIFHRRNTEFVSVASSICKSWNYVLTTDLSGYDKSVETLGNFLINSILVSLLTGIVAAYVITLITYRPVKKIVDVIDKSDNLHVTSRETNELLYITNNILNTLSSRNRAVTELEERIQALRKAQSLALQFQINPHFLYNTLETIKWCSVEEIGMGSRTSKLLTKVAKLYRYGLETGNVILTLREELQFLSLYLDICNARYGDSIRFNLEIDEVLYPCRMVKMSVQPLIENAIQHGLKPYGYKGEITIKAYVENDCLCIAVENDGQSLDNAGIRSINQNLQARTVWDSKKVGLLNVNERVKLLYGDRYGVTLSVITDGESRGVRSVVTFPYDKEVKN